MALIVCHECGKELSDKATNCPHCGYPLEVQKNDENTAVNQFVNQEESSNSSKKRKIIISVVAACIVIVILLLFGGQIFQGKKTKHALDAIGLIQNELLVPDSIQIYNIVTDEEAITFFIYYGAQNRGGGVTDTDCIVSLGSNSVFHEDTDVSDIADPTEQLDAAYENLYYALGLDGLVKNGVSFSEDEIDKINDLIKWK